MKIVLTKVFYVNVLCFLEFEIDKQAKLILPLEMMQVREQTIEKDTPIALNYIQL